MLIKIDDKTATLVYNTHFDIFIDEIMTDMLTFALLFMTHAVTLMVVCKLLHLKLHEE